MVGESPYPGMRAFEEEESPWFFGRAAKVDELLVHLRKSRLLPLVGASGVGKSSLVRAGLVPAVRAGKLDGRQDWRVAVMRPGSQPLVELAQAILRITGPDYRNLGLSGYQTPLQQLTARTQDPTFLAEVLSTLDKEAEDAPGVLLVVDQFEELFTATGDLAPNPLEIDRFLQNLWHALGQDEGRMSLVLTIRTEVLHRCMDGLNYQIASAFLDALQFIRIDLSPSVLEEVICGPARMSGADVESELVEQLMTDVMDLKYPWPVLQHCLRMIWQERDQSFNTLTLHDYKKIGGLLASMERTTDHVLREVSPFDVDAFHSVFRHLIYIGQGTSDVSRHAALGEFVKDSPERRVLSVLENHQIVINNGRTVRLAHDVWMYEWPQLTTWIDEDRLNLLFRQELRAAALRWQESGRIEDFLWSGAQLIRAAEIHEAEAPEVILSKIEQEFLEAGLAMERQRAHQHDELQRRQLMAARWSAYALGVVLVVFFIAVVGLPAVLRAAP